MTRSARKAALAVLIAVLPLTGLAAGSAAGQSTPEATVEAFGPLRPGQLVSVTGRGWPESSNVLVELCGRLGATTLDCDRPRSRTVGVGTDGLVSAVITAELPPTACPCVLRLSSVSNSTRLALPVEIEGAPNEPLPDPLAPEAPNALRIDGIHLEAAGGLGEWFGAAPRRTLTFRVTNAGPETLRDVPVEVLVGSDPVKGRQIDVEPIPVLESGASSMVAAEVELDALTVGHTDLQGAVGRDASQAAFLTGTSSFPWGLVVLGLVVLQIGLVLGRNALRRRLHPVPAMALPLSTGPMPHGWPALEAAEGLDLTRIEPVIDLRDVRTAVAVDRLRMATEQLEVERVDLEQTVPLLLARLDALRASATAPAGSVLIAAIALTPDNGGPRRVAVRAVLFDASAEPRSWVGLDDVDWDPTASDGQLTPSIVGAVCAEGQRAVRADDVLDPDLAALSGLLGGELLALRAHPTGRASAIAVGVTAPVAGSTHIVVVEAPGSIAGGVALSIRATRADVAANAGAAYEPVCE